MFRHSLCLYALLEFGFVCASDRALPKPPLPSVTAAPASTPAPIDAAAARVAAQHASLVMEAHRTEILGPYHPAHGEPDRPAEPPPGDPASVPLRRVPKHRNIFHLHRDPALLPQLTDRIGEGKSPFA